MEKTSAPLDPNVTYAPIGRCIYCTDTGANGLGDEHIIPFALNGTVVLPKASCHTCEGVTSYLDGFISRSVFYQVRSSAGLRTRSKLPTEFPVILKFADGTEKTIMAPADIHPSTLTLPKFHPPDILSGRRPDGNFRLTPMTWMKESADFDEFVQNQGAIAAEVATGVKPQQFSRVLAKIAHGFAVAHLGLEGFKPLLLDLIHGRNVTRGPELVGSELETPPASSGRMHELSVVPHHKFVVVRIRLFASSEGGGHAVPVYLVVAGIKSYSSRIAEMLTSLFRRVPFTHRRKNSRLRSDKPSQSSSSGNSIFR